MNATLESAARGLDEYARAAEWRCAQLMSMMQPMFDTYKVPTPPSLESTESFWLHWQCLGCAFHAF